MLARGCGCRTAIVEKCTSAKLLYEIQIARLLLSPVKAVVSIQLDHCCRLQNPLLTRIQEVNHALLGEVEHFTMTTIL